MFTYRDPGKDQISLLSRSEYPPEVEEGNIEYKLKLVNTSKERLEQLSTQLKWRLTEGSGQAMYEIGVSDQGILVGLDEKEMEASMKSLKLMGEAVHADMFLVRKKSIGNGLSVAEVLFRKCSGDEQHFLEIRIAVLGANDAGKSSFVGVLCHGQVDNGNGRARLNLLRHRHEIESGRTSSLAREIIGFAADGTLNNYKTSNVTTWEQICENSTKIITFLDSPGHKKYQKTTLGGLTGDASDYALLILNANYGGLADVAKEQIMLTKMLQVPIMICLTKIDIATKAQLTRTVQELMILLKTPGICILPSVVQSEDDISATMPLFVKGLTVPLFLISNVTGENIDLLKKFFNLLPKPSVISREISDGEMEFQIQDLFKVHGCGTVVGGIVKSGAIYLSGVFNPLICYIGPDHGRYTPVLVSSVHRQRVSVKKLDTAQAGTLALKFPVQEALEMWEKTGKLDGFDESLWVSDPPPYFKIRRGQSVCSYDSKPVAFREIEVDLSVLAHPTELHIGQEIIIYSGSVNQPARIADINSSKDSLVSKSSSELPLSVGNVKHYLPLSAVVTPEKSKKRVKLQNTTKLKQGESGKVTFRFLNEPEHLSLGAAVIIKGEKIKCVAKITRLLAPVTPPPRRNNFLLS